MSEEEDDNEKDEDEDNIMVGEIDWGKHVKRVVLAASIDCDDNPLYSAAGWTLSYC